MQVGFCHLDVVAKDTVVADPERLDTRPLPFLLLKLGDPVLPGRCQVPEAVEFRVEPLADHAARSGERRGVVDYSPGDEVCSRGVVGHHIQGVADERRSIGVKERFYARDRFERVPQRYKVARAGVSIGDPSGNPLYIGNIAESRAKRLPLNGAVKEPFHRIEPRLDGILPEQRRDQKRSHRPASHRCLREIEG